MGWLTSNYPTKWGTPTQAYISTCASDIRIWATNMGGYQQETYYVDEVQQTSSNEYIYGSNEEVTINTVYYDTIVSVPHTSNIIVPQQFALMCDAAVYPSKEHRLQNPMDVFERTQVYAAMNAFSNISVYDYIYAALAEKYPDGTSD